MQKIRTATVSGVNVVLVSKSVDVYSPLRLKTRKLCYRKDDRAMRPMGALKIFGTP